MCACAVVCFATFAFKMARDCKGNRRGRCLVCIECREFTPWAKNIRCAYCDCPPTKHESFPIHETTQREGTVTESFTENESGQDHRHDGENKLPNFEDNANQEFQATLINEDDVPSFARDDLQNGISNHENSSNNIETIPTCIKEEEDFSKVTGPNKILTCPICKKKFKKGLNLKSHILLHKGKRKFKCNICQGLFTALDQLAKHKLSHQQGRTEGSGTSAILGERQEENSCIPGNKIAKRRKITPKVTAIAPKQQSSLPPYQPALNLWGSSNQGAFFMSPLTTGLFPQVSMPTAQLMPTNTYQMGRGVQPVYQQTAQQTQSQTDNQSSLNQKLLNFMQMTDAKMSSLSQIDRKLDFIIHSLSMPRQPPIDTSNFTIETDQVARSFEQIAAQIDDPSKPTCLLSTSVPLPERLNFKRENLSPGEPIPDHLVDEAYKASVSRRNLAKNLVFMVFTPEELRGRNCSGKVYGKGLPKEKLDQRKLHSVKMATFKKYPCDPTEMDLLWQRECIKAIDKAIRSRALTNKL